jgi:hypothetical protein
MPAPPCNQLRNIVASDIGERLVLAEERNQECDLALGIVGAGMVLPDLERLPKMHW